MQKQITRRSVPLVLALGSFAVFGCSDKTSKPGETASATAPASTSATTPSQEKVKAAIDELTAIMNNAKEWKARGHNYNELSRNRAIADGIFPKQMLNESGGVVNPWGGAATIDPVPSRNAFCVVFSHIPAPDCVQLYTQGKSLFAVHAGSFGTEPANEQEAKSLCETGNMWFMPK